MHMHMHMHMHMPCELLPNSWTDFRLVASVKVV